MFGAVLLRSLLLHRTIPAPAHTAEPTPAPRSALPGTRKGDVVNLRIEWPRPVNGDTQAAMVIQNDGQGRLRITVADNLTPGGPVQQTSEIVLARQ
jgi:hypothetical protein